jgi:hypothetical protein
VIGGKMMEGGRLVYPLYTVRMRRGGRWVVKPEAEQLEGRTYRFRMGWQLTSEDTGIYAGEAAMVAVWDDAEYPYPETAPVWIASGDLYRLDEITADLVQQAGQ